MEIAAAGFPEALTGFKLAGLGVTSECNSDNADANVNGLMDDSQVGLVLLDQDLLQFLSVKTRRRIEASTKPVVITIPGRSGATASGKESISMMVKKAIGVELKSK